MKCQAQAFGTVSRPSRAPAVAALAALCLLGTPVAAATLPEIRALAAGQQYSEALKQLEAFLVDNPGDVEARLVWQATEQLRSAATDDYVQSTDLVLAGSLPLLRGAGQTAREDLIQSERNLVYAARDFERFRREFLVGIARDYFGLVGQLDAIANQERSLVSREQSYKRSRARVKAGQDPASSARRFEGDVLSTRGALIGAQERYRTSLDRFKIRLGIPVRTHVIIDAASAISLAEPAATPAEAARLALMYRLDLQNNRDRIADSRRAVAIARNNLLPDLNLNASLNLRTGNNERVGGFEREGGAVMDRLPRYGLRVAPRTVARGAGCVGLRCGARAAMAEHTAAGGRPATVHEPWRESCRRGSGRGHDGRRLL